MWATRISFQLSSSGRAGDASLAETPSSLGSGLQPPDTLGQINLIFMELLLESVPGGVRERVPWRWAGRQMVNQLWQQPVAGGVPLPLVVERADEQATIRHARLEQQAVGFDGLQVVRIPEKKRRVSLIKVASSGMTRMQGRNAGARSRIGGEARWVSDVRDIGCATQEPMGVLRETPTLAVGQEYTRPP